jgi:nitrite reductase/ring-hydroxylating ferredoxin subunit
MKSDETGWVAVALSEDIAAGSAAPVILHGAEFVVWRSLSGAVHAWEDRCPHRGMRLSFGFVRGEQLACLYHGWRFDADAACVSIPAHPDLEPPATICANAYPCIERGGFVLIDPHRRNLAPPDPAKVSAVRSLTVLASPTELLRGLDAVATGGFLRSTGPSGKTLLLALHPMDEYRTTLHIAVEGEADAALRAEVSAWGEDLRRRIEARDIAA